MCLCVCVCVKTGIHFYNSRSITTGVCDQPECVYLIGYTPTICVKPRVQKLLFA